MTQEIKVRQGTAEWFEMVGTLMAGAALKAGVAPDLNISMVERYTDGIELFEGLVQGIRFDIRGGVPSFRIGARPDEHADIIVEVTAAAARTLNLLQSADPEYRAALSRFMATGAMQVEGDPSRMGGWLEAVHDPIVDRTA